MITITFNFIFMNWIAFNFDFQFMVSFCSYILFTLLVTHKGFRIPPSYSPWNSEQLFFFEFCILSCFYFFQKPSTAHGGSVVLSDDHTPLPLESKNGPMRVWRVVPPNFKSCLVSVRYETCVMVGFHWIQWLTLSHLINNGNE